MFQVSVWKKCFNEHTLTVKYNLTTLPYSTSIGVHMKINWNNCYIKLHRFVADFDCLPSQPQCLFESNGYTDSYEQNAVLFYHRNQVATGKESFLPQIFIGSAHHQVHSSKAFVNSLVSPTNIPAAPDGESCSPPK